jgi:hypothetical protein
VTHAISSVILNNSQFTHRMILRKLTAVCLVTSTPTLIPVPSMVQVILSLSSDGIVEKKLSIVTCRPVAGQRVGNTSPRATNSRQHSDNFRFYATCCKYYNRGRGVFYVVRICPLLGNGCVFYESTSRLYKQTSSKSEVSRRTRTRTRTERVLCSQVRRVRMKIDCESL